MKHEPTHLDAKRKRKEGTLTEAKSVPGRARAEAVMPSLWMPTPIIVSITAANIEMKETTEKLTTCLEESVHVSHRHTGLDALR